MTLALSGHRNRYSYLVVRNSSSLASVPELFLVSCISMFTQSSQIVQAHFSEHTKAKKLLREEMKAFKSMIGTNSKKRSGASYEDTSDNHTCSSGASLTSKASQKSTSSRGAAGGPSKDEIDFFLNADKNLLLARMAELAVEDEAEAKARKKSSKTSGGNKTTKGPLEKRRNESNASALQRALAEGHI